MPLTVAEIIIELIKKGSQMLKHLSPATHYSLDGVEWKEIPADWRNNIHTAGTYLHVDIVPQGPAAADFAGTIAGERLLLDPSGNSNNKATLNGQDCPGGVYFHNETTLPQALGLKAAISYGIKHPANNKMIRFLVPVQLAGLV